MKLNNTEQLIAAHVPVIHKGYLEMAEAYPNAPVGIFDSSVIGKFDYLRKDIRALEPEQAVQAFEGFGRRALLLSHEAIVRHLQTGDRQLIMPADDITESLVSANRTPETDVIQHPVFLRWDRNNVETNQEVQPDRVVSSNDVDETVIELLSSEASKSSDWWRHVSAALVKDGAVEASSHNHGLPTEYGVYIDGDPRITQKRGSNIEASLFVHAESSLIAEMAKKGTSTEGASIYVSTFPCPNCAKIIATSGIKECYYTEGYAMVDGYDVLKSAGVEIIKIDTAPIDGDRSSLLLPYPSSQS